MGASLDFVIGALQEGGGAGDLLGHGFAGLARCNVVEIVGGGPLGGRGGAANVLGLGWNMASGVHGDARRFPECVRLLLRRPATVADHAKHVLVRHHRCPRPLHHMHGTQTVGCSTDEYTPPLPSIMEPTRPPLREHPPHGRGSSSFFLRFFWPRLLATLRAFRSRPGTRQEDARERSRNGHELRGRMIHIAPPATACRMFLVWRGCVLVRPAECPVRWNELGRGC